MSRRAPCDLTPLIYFDIKSRIKVAKLKPLMNLIASKPLNQEKRTFNHGFRNPAARHIKAQ